MKNTISILLGILVAIQIWSYSIKNELITIYKCIENNVLDITPALKTRLIETSIENNNKKWTLINQIEIVNKYEKEISQSKIIKKEIKNKINTQIVNQYILINESIKIYNKNLSHPLKKLALIKYNFQKIPAINLNINKKPYIMP